MQEMTLGGGRFCGNPVSWLLAMASSVPGAVHSRFMHCACWPERATAVRMARGRQPVSGAFLGAPRWVDGAAEAFTVILGG